MAKDFEQRLSDLVARFPNTTDDPFGFHRMSPAQLANWLGAGHAEVGSPRWEQAKAVYDLKLAELGQSSIRSPEPTSSTLAPTPRRWWERIHWVAVGGVCTVVLAVVAVAALFVG